MSKGLWIQIAATAFVTFGGAANLLADATVQQAAAGGSSVQYIVTNTGRVDPYSNYPLEITMLLVPSISGSSATPWTTNKYWIAESVNATNWTTELMARPDIYNQGPITFSEFCGGASYTNVFPSDPVSVNAYYLEFYGYYSISYSFPDAPGLPSFEPFWIKPGQSMLGFFSSSSSLNSTYWVIGHDPYYATGYWAYTGSVTDVPEPFTFPRSATLAVCALGLRRWRRGFPGRQATNRP